MLIRCLLLFFVHPIACYAQALPQLDDLSAAEYVALERASEASVTGTISFLASDELAGRGTPSPELTIATAYVASRLRAAGAEGLGPNGSFYLESTIETLQTPRDGCLLETPQDSLRYRLLQSANEAINYRGLLTKIAGDQPLPNGFAGPVLLAGSQGDRESSSPLINLQQQSRRLAAGGATLMLVEADPDSPLWNLAEQFQARSRVDSARGKIQLPIVVVEAGRLVTATEIALTLPANIQQATPVRNVAGVLRGSDPAHTQEAVLFSAHLDHLGAGAAGDDPIYNGADDDASGVTGVLTLADVFGALPTRPKRSLVFVTFWGEERGLLGSKKFVERSPWPLDKITANINLEMLGRPEEGAVNKCWMTGWSESNLGSLMGQGSRRVGVEVFEHPSFSARLYGASDNYSFAQKGVIAHSFSAGSLHADYHQPSDEWQKLNLQHMTQVIRGLYAGTLPLAHAQLTPDKKGQTPAKK